MAAPTALIAEDEPLLAAALRADLATLWPELRLLPTAADGRSALDAALAQAPELLFLDIRMPGLTGLEVAAALAEDWPDERAFPLLVFVTAYDQYAVQAFEAQAVDYLVKPVTRERLDATVQRLKARLRDRGPARGPGPDAGLEQALVQLRSLLAQVTPAMPGTVGTPPRLQVIQAQAGSLVHLVPVDQVLYFEAADKYVRVLTAEHEYLIRTALRELLPRLDERVFWQVHRGTVVRASAIDTVTRDEAGRLHLGLRGRPERPVVSRLYAHRFRAF